VVAMMAPKRESYVPPSGVEPGIHHMPDEAREDHYQRMREGNLRRARREAKGHEKDCGCWACIYLRQEGKA